MKSDIAWSVWLLITYKWRKISLTTLLRVTCSEAEWNRIQGLLSTVIYWNLNNLNYQRAIVIYGVEYRRKSVFQPYNPYQWWASLARPSQPSRSLTATKKLEIYTLCKNTVFKTAVASFEHNNLNCSDIIPFLGKIDLGQLFIYFTYTLNITYYYKKNYVSRERASQDLSKRYRFDSQNSFYVV